MYNKNSSKRHDLAQQTAIEQTFRRMKRGLTVPSWKKAFALLLLLAALLAVLLVETDNR